METTATQPGFTDADVMRRVASYLSTRHFPSFRGLNISVDRAVVTVSGCLNTYYEKQVALNTCRRVAGVVELIDEISVAEEVMIRRVGV